jgi:hypothetical protein
LLAVLLPTPISSPSGQWPLNVLKMKGVVKMGKLFIVCVFLLLTACALVVPQRFGQLSVGMTKADVLKIMEVSPAQFPSQFKAYLNSEYIIYETHHGDYFVRLIDGKVNAYGKVGDFDSLKDPAFNVNIKTETINK